MPIISIHLRHSVYAVRHNNSVIVSVTCSFCRNDCRVASGLVSLLATVFGKWVASFPG